jgi:HprK-related kinase A
MADVSALHIRILDLQARVIGPKACLTELPKLFPTAAGWTTSGDPELVTTIQVQVDVPEARRYQITKDGIPLLAIRDPQEIPALLEWAVNTAAVAELGARYLLLHAGAVSYRDRGMLLPAASGAGKSTLVAGLVASGLQYLSDEVGVLDPRTQMLLPFAKSMCVKNGAIEVLAPLYPELKAGAPRYRLDEPICYLGPPPDSWPDGPVPVHFVVLPRYRRRARTVLTPVPRSTVLRCLLEQSFSLRRHGSGGVRSIVGVLRDADCYTLTFSDLGQAVDLLLKLATTA